MEEKRYCPNCNMETMQATTPYDPDDPDSGEVWLCSNCREIVDVVKQEAYLPAEKFKKIGGRDIFIGTD